MKLFYEKYIKLAHIGRGANAHVYKVKHAELGYIRAIKILNDYIENKSDKAYQSFLRECRTLLAIGNGSHPNIVHIYGPDLIENRAIVEMDYIEGSSIESYVSEKKGFIEYDEILTFIHDIVGALAYTHHDIYKFLMDPEEDSLETDPNNGSKYLISADKERELVQKYGIAHNDLHSNNVMRRDYDGSFVLLDFGLAVQNGECVKSSGKSAGNPEYKAPEKFDSDEITPRSDIYSIGVLLYQLLTGQPPFILHSFSNGDVSLSELNKIRDQHLHKAPSPILPLRKAAFERVIPGAVYERDYPQWLDDVVIKCLAKKPEDRYTDAKQLLDDINTHLATDDKQDPPKKEEIHADNESRDKKLPLVIAGALISVMLVLGYFFIKGGNDYKPLPIEKNVSIEENVPTVIEEAPIAKPETNVAPVNNMVEQTVLPPVPTESVEAQSHGKKSQKKASSESKIQLDTDPINDEAINKITEIINNYDDDELTPIY